MPQFTKISTGIIDCVSQEEIATKKAVLYAAGDRRGNISLHWLSQDSLERCALKCPLTRGTILWSLHLTQLGENAPVAEGGQLLTEHAKLQAWYQANQLKLQPMLVKQVTQVDRLRMHFATLDSLRTALPIYVRTYAGQYNEVRLKDVAVERVQSCVASAKLNKTLASLEAMRRSLWASGSRRLLGLLNDFFSALPDELLTEAMREELLPKRPCLRGFWGGAGRKVELKKIIHDPHSVRKLCCLPSYVDCCNQLIERADRSNLIESRLTGNRA